MRALCAWIVLLAASVSVADQTGAEKVKQPVSASVVGAREIPDWEGQKIGNVRVVYADGSKDQWTLKKNASMPQVSKEGVVGWVLTPLDEDGKSLFLYKGTPTFPELRLVKAGRILATIEAERPFIEKWGFSDDGRHVVVKSRGLHGPAFLQRFVVQDGAEAGSSLAFGENLPDWAEGYGE